MLAEARSWDKRKGSRERRKAAQFAFDFDSLQQLTSMQLTVDVLKGAHMGTPTAEATPIMPTSGTHTAQVMGQQQGKLRASELPLVSVQLLCKAGGVALKLRLAAREKLDFSTAPSPTANLLLHKADLRKQLGRRSVELGRERMLADEHASDTAHKEAEAGERKRWKDWDDVEALREQRAAPKWGMRKAEAKQGRTDAELEAARARWVVVEKEMAEEAATREAERKHERKLRKQEKEKAADAVAMEREKRKDAEEQVVRLQEEMGKEELVRRRVAEENARSKKRSSAFEAASEKVCCLFTHF